MTTYSEKLLDPRWQKKRLEILSRDQFTCMICFDSASTLHVHHRIYRPKTEPWDYPEWALVTLCASCHAGEYDDGRERTRLWESLAKCGFSLSDINTISEGFETLQVVYAPDVTASVLQFLFSSRELMDNAREAFFEHLKNQPKPF